MKKLLGMVAVCLILITTSSYAAVSNEALINVNDATTGTLAPRRVKDAGNITDASSSGVLSVGPLVYNGTTWDRLKGDATNGVFVNIKSSVALTFTGAITPADTFTNPTNAVNSYSLLGGWNGTTWDRVGTAATNADGLSTTTIGNIRAATYNLIFNGSTWDRQRSGVILGEVRMDTSSNASSNITTNTTTVIKGTAGVFGTMIVNTAGTTSIVAFYNIASAGCTGTPASGYAWTSPTTTLNAQPMFNHTFTLGICAVTTGGAAANISVLYR